MKRINLFILCTIALLAITSVSSYASITGSKHDFSSKAWSAGQICIVCHTPHNAAVSTSGPLWNHTSTTQTFTMYSNTTIDGTVDGSPNSPSKTCLSCHDGLTAVDSYGGATGTILLNTTNFPGTKSNLGTDLGNDHPISISYTATTASTDGSLYNPTTTTVTALGGGTITNKMLFSNKVECASCHDVHNSGAAATNGKMLRVSNTASAMCLTCHNK